jgi:hypothetical protein
VGSGTFIVQVARASSHVQFCYAREMAQKEGKDKAKIEAQAAEEASTTT